MRILFHSIDYIVLTQISNGEDITEMYIYNSVSGL